jgi:hypothetical protein
MYKNSELLVFWVTMPCDRLVSTTTVTTHKSTRRHNPEDTIGIFTAMRISKSIKHIVISSQGSISQWKFTTLTVQYTTLDYSSQLF